MEIDRRYLITKKGAKPDYLLPVRFMDGQTEYDAFAPRENVRIKKKGGGLNFVHGGISLQEMVVPVLEFQFLRNAYKMYQRNKDKIDTKPVTISLLSASRKISNMIFSLNFYQKEAVGGNREAATYARNRHEKEHTLSNPRHVEALGNKALLEKRINIRASDYRFSDKVKYYKGFENARKQMKEGTKIKELTDLADSIPDFTEADIVQRTSRIIFGFVEFMHNNGLLSEE